MAAITDSYTCEGQTKQNLSRTKKQNTAGMTGDKTLQTFLKIFLII